MRKKSKIERVLGLGLPEIRVPGIEKYQTKYYHLKVRYLTLKYVIAVSLLGCQLTIAVLAIAYPHLNYFIGGLGSFNAMFTIVSGYASCDAQIAKYTIILDKLETLHLSAVNMTAARITAELNAIIGREAPYVSDFFLDKEIYPDDGLMYSMEKVFQDE